MTAQGEEIRYQEFLTIMLNKPAGVLSATEDRRQTTVLDLLPEGLRRRGLFPAGRLDKDTTGLLLITDDGSWPTKCSRPKATCTSSTAPSWTPPWRRPTSRPLPLASPGRGEQYVPARLWVEQDPRAAFVEIREGRFHQVKRMFQARGKTVLQLKRLKIGGLWLDSTLQEGECRLLTPQEIQAIFH